MDRRSAACLPLAPSQNKVGPVVTRGAAHTHMWLDTHINSHTPLYLSWTRPGVADSFYRRRSDYSGNSSKAAHFHTVSFPPLDSPLLSRLVARPSSATGLLTVCCSPFQNNPNFLLLMEFLYFCSSLKLFLFKRKKHIYSSKIPEASGP